MRPFSAALYRMAAGRTTRMSTFLVNSEAKLAIRLWRTMLVLVRFDEERYSRPMQSFVKTMPEYIIEFDASLSGVGILWYKRLTALPPRHTSAPLTLLYHRIPTPDRGASNSMMYSGIVLTNDCSGLLYLPSSKRTSTNMVRHMWSDRLYRAHGPYRT